MNTGFIFARYRIPIDGSYINDKRKVPLSQTQIDDFSLKVGNIFDEILRRKTGQIILQGIRDSGWAIVVFPYTVTACNSQTVGRPARDLVERYGFNVAVQFKLDLSACAVDPKTKGFKPAGTPAESLFHQLVHPFVLSLAKPPSAQDP